MKGIVILPGTGNGECKVIENPAVILLMRLPRERKAHQINFSDVSSPPPRQINMI